MFHLSFKLYFGLIFLSACLSNPTDSGVIFTYPNASTNLTFNYIDTVEVRYSTPWPNVNLWVYCLESTNSPYPENYQTYDNPLHQSGAVNIEHIGAPDDLQGIVQYPTPCWFKIADARFGNAGGDGDKVSGVIGGNFTLKSVDAVPTQTWSAGASQTDLDTDIAAATSTASTSSSELSIGAKAGIGASIGVLCLALVGVGVYVFALRKKMNLQREEVKKLKTSRDNQEHKSRSDPLRGTSMTPGAHASMNHMLSDRSVH